MRQLKPEVVEQRKKHLLQWIVHYYIKTSLPVSSSLIAEEAGLDLSSATIRSILQDLEDHGRDTRAFLNQVVDALRDAIVATVRGAGAAYPADALAALARENL